MGLLDRAKMMLQGRTKSVPSRTQYYHVACVEGHILHGQRTEGYQALRCPTCGEGIFVLPRSPLPEPAAPAATSAGRRAPAASRFDDDRVVLTDPPPPAEVAEARSESAPARPAAPLVEPEARIEWVDEVPADPASEPSPRPVPSRSKAAPVAVKAAPRHVASDPPAVSAGMVAVEDRPSVAGWAWRRRNPLIFLAVALVVLATFGLLHRQKWLDELPKVAEIGRTQGLSKLDEGDFHVAKKLLGDAASAVDSLGGQYEGADAIRQGAREAALFADRVKEPLEALVEMAAKYQPPDAWPRHFDAIYRGQSVILEAQVVSVRDPDRAGSAYEIDYRIYFGNGPTPAGKGRFDLKGFRLFEQAQPKVGDVKVFGARLASITLDVNTGEYLVALEPDSGAFITHFQALEVIGWPAVEPVDQER